MLTAENLSKRFPGAPAPTVDTLDLAVASGELFALLGPNRAGKATAINCVLEFVMDDGLKSPAPATASSTRCRCARPCPGSAGDTEPRSPQGISP